LGQLIKNGGIRLFYLKETYFPQLIKNSQIVDRGSTTWELTVPFIETRCDRRLREVVVITLSSPPSSSFLAGAVVWPGRPHGPWRPVSVPRDSESGVPLEAFD